MNFNIRTIGFFSGLTIASVLLMGYEYQESSGTAPQSTSNSSQVSQSAATSAPQVISGAGDEVPKVVEAYRQALGGVNNSGKPGSQPSGRREINWDGVPDQFAAPNNLPSDFFNAPTEPRARGALLTTPGTALQVSADSDNPTDTPVRFAHINPSYRRMFHAFSEQRLFSPIGSHIVDLTFYVPGTKTPAVVRGFGAVYLDVDTKHTAFEYFDINGKSLGTFQTPIADNGQSFLGVVFPNAIVHRVRIRYGTTALGPNDGVKTDVAVMDDFIYGEPQPAQ